jgi:hypothetical protein
LLLSKGEEEEEELAGFRIEAVEAAVSEDGDGGLIVAAAALDFRPLQKMGLRLLINNPRLPQDPPRKEDGKAIGWRPITR